MINIFLGLKKLRLVEEVESRIINISNLNIYREIRLISVLNLRKVIDNIEYKGMKELFEDYKFVGCVNKLLVFV